MEVKSGREEVEGKKRGRKKGELDNRRRSAERKKR